MAGLALAGVQIVKGEAGKAGEIADQDIARGLLAAILGLEALDVSQGLGVGLVEISAAGFVFGDQSAGPEQVDEVVMAAQGAHGRFKAGHGAPADAEEVEKFVPESLGLGALAGDIGPFTREKDGALTDFVPGEGHGG